MLTLAAVRRDSIKGTVSRVPILLAPMAGACPVGLSIAVANTNGMVAMGALLTEPDAPPPAPYPVQRGLTAPMREAGGATCDYHRMQMWAGQSAWMAKPILAGDLVREIWNEAEGLL